MGYLLMLPPLLWGLFWGLEVALGMWVRRLTQRPAPT